LSWLLISEDHVRTWTNHGVLLDEPNGRFANVFSIQYGKDYTSNSKSLHLSAAFTRRCRAVGREYDHVDNS